jgi:rubredoxin
MNDFCVATFNERPPAEMLRQELLNAGLPAEIHDESRAERFWFFSQPLAAIHVKVKAPDYLKARQLIQEWDAARSVLKEAVRCPDCGSSRVEFPQVTRKFLSPAVHVLLMTLRIVPREFHCRDCYFTWPPESEKPVEPERDVMGWPVRSRLLHSKSSRAQKRK